ncbi:hypothetical protein [Streptomyces sp. NPDC056628]|uniref:hypothetical protein n=1 Tax=Streptomyces sp. NPDC056628 TaxID=3345882 RepID=UPI003675C2DD
MPVASTETRVLPTSFRARRWSGSRERPYVPGDTFAAGFLAGLVRGRTMTAALRPGRPTAGSALRVTGDHGPLPDRERMEALLALPEAEGAALPAPQV